MDEIQLLRLVETMRGSERGEQEWIEVKRNDKRPDDIGANISALSNVARLLGKNTAYIMWGYEDETIRLVGTTFRPRTEKVGNQELESWLAGHLSPSIDFRIHELSPDGKKVVVFEVHPCIHSPVRWKEQAYIRVGTYTKKLGDFPERERELWTRLSRVPFENGIAEYDLSIDDALRVLAFDSYFRLTDQNLPATKRGILERLEQEKLVERSNGSRYNVTNLGAILFASKLSEFPALGRKAVRVISYAGTGRVDGGRENVAELGYAAGFEGLLAYISDRIPTNEHIGQALRAEVRMYPSIAIREFVANALIHQDFSVTGDSPLIEVFKDRIEFTNSGRPLIDPLRFIDEPPQSRNETLASIMRRMNICEERGSGIDKALDAVQLFQLPAPDFMVTENHTKVVLYAHRPFKNMSSKDRIRACYQHASLMHVTNQQMTNSSLRARFSISDEDYPIVSAIISNAIRSGLVKPYDPDSKSKRHAKYVPFWA